MAVLFKRHFQIAYVVADIHAAMAAFKENHGVAQWDLMDMVAVFGDEAASTHIANAWAGDVMIELMQPNPRVSSIYDQWLAEAVTPMRLHHLGFLIDDDAQMAAHRAQLVANGHAIVSEGSFGDVLDFAYADTTAQLGHYVELIHLKAEGQAFFDRIPVN